MALRTCPDCNTNISSHGIVCFKCGRRLSVEYRIMGLPFYFSTQPLVSTTGRIIIMAVLTFIAYNVYSSHSLKKQKIAEAENYTSKKYQSSETTNAPAKAIYEIPKVKQNELSKF